MADNFNILDYGDLQWLNSDNLTSGESSFNRRFINNQSLTMTSQGLRLAYFTARRAEPITQVQVATTGTAAGATPSLVRIGIWTADAAGALLALVGSTANDTALLAGTTTAYTKALSATWNKVAGQRYAIGLLVVTAAAAPTIGGWNTNTIPSARSPKLSGLISSQADLPASAAAGSVADSGNGPYIEMLP